MEYQIPQFIEVEDKIFGPFTFMQFVYIAGGAGGVAIAFLLLPFILALIVALPVAGLAGALAFYKVNNKPFSEILEAGFIYLMGGRLYQWRKEEHPVTAPIAPVAPIEAPKEKLGLTRNRLHDLAWSLDIKDQGGAS